MGSRNNGSTTVNKRNRISQQQNQRPDTDRIRSEYERNEIKGAGKPKPGQPQPQKNSRIVLAATQTISDSSTSDEDSDSEVQPFDPKDLSASTPVRPRFKSPPKKKGKVSEVDHDGVTMNPDKTPPQSFGTYLRARGLSLRRIRQTCRQYTSLNGAGTAGIYWDNFSPPPGFTVNDDLDMTPEEETSPKELPLSPAFVLGNRVSKVKPRPERPEPTPDEYNVLADKLLENLENLVNSPNGLESVERGSEELRSRANEAGRALSPNLTIASEDDAWLEAMGNEAEQMYTSANNSAEAADENQNGSVFMFEDSMINVNDNPDFSGAGMMSTDSTKEEETPRDQRNQETKSNCDVTPKSSTGGSRLGRRPNFRNESTVILNSGERSLNLQAGQPPSPSDSIDSTGTVEARPRILDTEFDDTDDEFFAKCSSQEVEVGSNPDDYRGNVDQMYMEFENDEEGDLFMSQVEIPMV